MHAIYRDLPQATDPDFVCLLQFLSGVQAVMHRKSLSLGKMRTTELFTAFFVIPPISGTLLVNKILS